MEHAAFSERFGFEEGLARGDARPPLSGVLNFLEGATEHRGDELEAWKISGAKFADESAIAQDGDPIGNRVDLIEEMGHEQDRHAFTAETAHDFEQEFNFAFVEAG